MPRQRRTRAVRRRHSVALPFISGVFRGAVLSSAILSSALVGVTSPSAAAKDPKAAKGAKVVSDGFDPKEFAGGPASNRWWPLTPGYQSVREGGLDRGHRRLTHRRVYTVTDVTKEVAGVRTVLVLDQDIDAGEVVEQAIDYLAGDVHGNVWYLGSYTEGYDGGVFLSANDAWLAGVRGGRAGVLMMAEPKTGTPKYSQAYVPGEGAATAKVSKLGTRKCVPFKCYDNVLVIEEGGENVFYAPGVGAIGTEPRHKGGENETEALVNLTQLSPEGLAELSAEALSLDRHARTTASRVFGTSEPAKRSG